MKNPRLSRRFISGFRLLLIAVFLAAPVLSALGQPAIDAKARAEMRANLIRQINTLEAFQAKNPPGDPQVQKQIDTLKAQVATLDAGGGAPAPGPAAAPAPKHTPPVPPDPSNPWTIPGAMWTQKEDGSYEYYRLQKSKDGRNQTITVIPTVTKDGRVIWTDKKK